MANVDGGREQVTIPISVNNGTAVVESGNQQNAPTEPVNQTANEQTPEPNPAPRLSLTLGFNFNPMQDSRRIIANNLSTIGGEISPLINLSRSRPALSLQEWLNPTHQRLAPIQAPPPNNNEQTNHVVINIDPPVDEHESSQNSNSPSQTFSDNFDPNTPRENDENNQNNINNNNNNESNDPNAPVTLTAETRILQKNIESCISFLLIILTKFIYDNGAELLNFVLLVVTFIQANNDLKREILKQKNRSLLSLVGILCYITGCFIFIDFVFKEPIFYLYKSPETIAQLLWTVAISDFVLKLITVAIKVLFTCLPEKIVPFQKRGRFYLVMEATSQLYRNGSPVYLWLQYLSFVYDGPHKVLAIVLFVMYGIYKTRDTMYYFKHFCIAVGKMLQNVSLGTCPSKEQIVASGGSCAICHEEYTLPVRLSCKHIFCEGCVTTWLDREKSCPLCRASITDDPIYRDGHTTHFVQLY
ncbi:RING finger and transmembrane domain-containing protein 2 [Trichogramma pretiosum]|uniref:RING finger and transmembrane domain-containing protein 2 n=1 Tax=Trichogramma pretiosum TaxID=7493 RepID=UPI0006C9B6E5|nr:RING finger and transmembrane domain-containing protein 2 [Trichogramma pretiosum]XP_014228125.1 RING finger and transmembrane domain-containing protein 2 [Trichogramma pretiosum]